MEKIQVPASLWGVGGALDVFAGQVKRAPGFIQNIGLWGIPVLIGTVLENYCITGKTVVNGQATNMYDYTLPMCIFTGIAVLSMLVAFCLKAADKKYGYRLEEPNTK